MKRPLGPVLDASRLQFLADLARTTLANGPLDQLFALAMDGLIRGLRIQQAGIFEVVGEGKTLRLSAGVGWSAKSKVGLTISPRKGSHLSVALSAADPVWFGVSDASLRKTIPLLARHRIVSGLALGLGSPQRRWGVLAVYSEQHRAFNAGEVDFFQTVAGVLATAVRGFHADQAQRDGSARVSAIVNTLVDGVVTIDEDGTIESINPAAQKLFGYSSDELLGRNVSLLMPQPDRRLHDQYLRNYFQTGQRRIIGIGREVIGRRKDGSEFPMELAVSELMLSGRRMFTGVVRDVTERRRLEREILSAAAHEQRRIGQDLHDGLCQHLAGISFATEVLRQKLEARAAPESLSISKIGRMVDDAITQARDLARGLQPVELDANGLSSSLKTLTEKVESIFHVTCLFVSGGPCPVEDNNIATHLYRIAQEAIANAIKHGKARTIVVDLARSAGDLLLMIKDDGVGLRTDNRTRTGSGGAGIGLKTMQYRARVIGGVLEVASSPARGTTILCRLRGNGGVLQPVAAAPRLVKDSGNARKKSRKTSSQTARKAADPDPRRRRSPHRPRAVG
jgi:PAS domain S-box-containing protein